MVRIRIDATPFPGASSGGGARPSSSSRASASASASASAGSGSCVSPSSHLRKIPVVHGDDGLDPLGDQCIDEVVVEGNSLGIGPVLRVT